MKGAGGTSGGLGSFFLGAILTVAGAYLLSNQVIVSTGYWRFYGYSGFGITLLPLLLGIALLFFNGRSLWGWALTALGVLVIFLGIILNLDIHFRPTTLFNTLWMLGLVVAGLGLVARSLRTR
ncbi:MAG: hypothetical protein HY329_03030 [Chloroflexi bacterium]|nr:hypothetical protein [Chloroflexota bacterium]